MILIASKDKLNTEAIHSHCDRLNREGILSSILFITFFMLKVLEGK